MKQKIVVQVYMNCGKCRTKVMKIAAVESGVSSVQISGENKDQVVVIGEKVDSVKLTRSLRKKVGSARLLSVEVIKEEKKKEEIKKEEKKVDDYCSTNQNYPQPLVCYQLVHDSYPNNCSIM